MNLLRRPRWSRRSALHLGRGARLRLDRWPTDATVGHLLLLDPAHAPTVGEVDRIVDAARRDGLRAVRTSALFPEAAERFLTYGFVRLDTLTLLRLDLDPDTTTPATPRWSRLDPDRSTARPGHDRRTGTTPGVGIRPLRGRHETGAAEVDRLAFGPLWGYDRRTVTEVRRATPAHWARRIGPRDRLEGYAISGAGGTTGYLQRLAVRPDRHRCGLASALVDDSLRWMTTRGLGVALVNTGSGNRAALALYQRFGFRALPERLTVAELSLTAATNASARDGASGG